VGRQIAADLVAALATFHENNGISTRKGIRAALPPEFITATRLIGDAIGVRLAEKTWRNIVSESLPT
jgi:hypothetical protein